MTPKSSPSGVAPPLWSMSKRMLMVSAWLFVLSLITNKKYRPSALCSSVIVPLRGPPLVTFVTGPAPAHSPAEAVPSRVMLALGTPKLIILQQGLLACAVADGQNRAAAIASGIRDCPIL